MEMPIKTIPGISDKKLEKACAELEAMGYIIIQRKRQGDEHSGSWTLKAKLSQPPYKPNRKLVD